MGLQGLIVVEDPELRALLVDVADAYLAAKKEEQPLPAMVDELQLLGHRKLHGQADMVRDSAVKLMALAAVVTLEGRPE